jgi:hypothetical protein
VASILTTIGAAKMAAAQGGGAPLVFAEIAVGSGALTPAVGTTALVAEVWRGDVNAVRSASSGVIEVEAIVPADEGGWTIREYAIIDADDDVVVCGTIGPLYKAADGTPEAGALLLRPSIAVSSVTGITLTSDDGTVLATREYVDELRTLVRDGHVYSPTLRKLHPGRPLFDIDGGAGTVVARAGYVYVASDDDDLPTQLELPEEIDLDLVGDPGPYDVYLQYSEDRQTVELIARPYMYWASSLPRVTVPPARNVLVGGFCVGMNEQPIARSAWDLCWRSSSPNPRGMVLVGGQILDDDWAAGAEIGSGVVGAVEAGLAYTINGGSFQHATTAPPCGLLWVDIWPASSVTALGLSGLPWLSTDLPGPVYDFTNANAITALAGVGKRLPTRAECVLLALGATSPSSEVDLTEDADSRSVWGVEHALHDDSYWTSDLASTVAGYIAGGDTPHEVEELSFFSTARVRGVAHHLVR